MDFSDDIHPKQVHNYPYRFRCRTCGVTSHLGPHRPAMQKVIADILGISIDRVGIKATTMERMGFIGREEGMAAIATATVRLPV